MRGPDTNRLDALDARLRESSTRVHRAVTTRLAETRATSNGTQHDPLRAVEQMVRDVPVTRFAPTRRRRLAHRSTLAAAALLVVVGLVAGLLALRGDDRPGVTTGQGNDLATPPYYWLPGWLPGGLVLVDGSLRDPAADPAVSGTLVVYGDPNNEERWNTDHLLVMRGKLPAAGVDLVTRGRLPAAGVDDPEFQPATVGGMQVEIAEPRAAHPDVGGTIIVQWGDDSADMHRVVGHNVGRDQVLDAVAHVVDGPSVVADGLPGGFEELGRGPLSYRSEPQWIDEFGGLSVQYRQAGTNNAIYIAQRPGTAEELDLYLLANEQAEETTILGQRGYIQQGMAEFFDPGSGQMVTVNSTYFYDQPERWQEFLESLQQVSRADVEQLIEPFLPPTDPPPLAENETVEAENETVVAAGENDGTWWRLVVSGDADGPYTVAMDTEIGRESMRIDPTLGTWEDIYLNLGEGGMGREQLWPLFGTVRGNATELRAEFGTADPAQVLEVFEVEDWPVKVWVGFVPIDLPNAKLTATDSSGGILARLLPEDYAEINSARPGPMATGADPATTPCPVLRTFPDGETVCLVSE